MEYGTWAELYMRREIDRQRREAAVALQRVKLAKGEGARRKAMIAALAVIVEQCPAMWGE